ncbi:MAG: ABC transporter permease [Gammaproteobacteria bacterium]|nr:ABC transporter permease [Gammaproteobacteria bacterium]
MERLKASSLALPLIAFVIVTLLVPIFSLVRLSVYDSTVADALPKTAEALQQWSGTDLPSIAVFETLAEELTTAQQTRELGRIASRVNRILSGSRSTISKTPRRFARSDEPDARAAFIAIDEDWGELDIWHALKQATDTFTSRNFLQAVDFRLMPDGSIARMPETQQVYVTLFIRTLGVSIAVTALCFFIGYPMAYAMAHASPGWARLLLVLVLIPFWTSLLVRTTSWIVILQQQGVLNDILVFIGLVADDNRLTMVHNMTGTLVAMTQVLLPFMILPLYSVMTNIPRDLTKAASSLGANPFQSFTRVYFPNSLPGVAAGGLLVFILSIGYYITPALVGGSKGQLISNLIAYHLQTSLNWGLAAALSVILLVGVMVLYVVYDRFIGIDRMKLG